MRFDQMAIMEGQRRAYAALLSPSIRDGAGNQKANPHQVPAKLTTAPAMLIQELPFLVTTQTYNFDFSINGPAQTPGTNNNVKIRKNDVFAAYALQMLFTSGTDSATFIYRGHGLLAADNSMYNSIVSIKTEASTYVDKIEGQFFRDLATNSSEYYGEVGMQLLNPVRIVSGELGVLTVTLALKNPISTLVLTANAVISMRLHGIYGQARG